METTGAAVTCCTVLGYNTSQAGEVVVVGNCRLINLRSCRYELRAKDLANFRPFRQLHLTKTSNPRFAILAYALLKSNGGSNVTMYFCLYLECLHLLTSKGCFICLART
jgi:hypothetical protein